MTAKPWTTGPREILEHGISLIRKNTDSSRRLAFLSIDNGVELTIKTFLGLPQRVSGVSLTKKQFELVSNSFPKLLQTLEAEAGKKIRDIDIDVIEWYHRLRNQLYHNGNGLTVDRAKVETYAGIGVSLFERLFDEDISISGVSRPKLLAEYMGTTSRLGRILQEWYRSFPTVSRVPSTPRHLVKKRVIDDETAMTIERLSSIREQLTVDDAVNAPAVSTKDIKLTNEIANSLERMLRER